MILLVFPCLMLMGGGPNSTDQEAAALAKMLRNRLSFDVLWRQLPEDVNRRLPMEGSATVRKDKSTFSFCSLDLGLCAEYFVNQRTLGDLIAMKPFPPGNTEIQALEAFRSASGTSRTHTPEKGIGRSGTGPRFQTPSGQMVGGIPAGANGTGTAAGEVKSVRFQLGTRDAVMKEYRSARTTRLNGVLDFLRKSLKDSEYDYRSLRVACFKDSDPYIVVLGDRSVGGEIIHWYRWNQEGSQYEFAASAESHQNRENFSSQKQTVESMTCGTVQLK